MRFILLGVQSWFIILKTSCYECMLSHFTRVQLLRPYGPLPIGHGILQGRLLERVAVPSSRGSFQPKDRALVSYISCNGRQVLYHQCHLGSPRCYKSPIIHLNQMNRQYDFINSLNAKKHLKKFNKPPQQILNSST